MKKIVIVNASPRAQWNAATLDAFIGKTKFFISGNTLQVKNYDRFDWTLFDVNEKIRRHEEDFPKEEEKAFILGKDIVSNPW